MICSICKQKITSNYLQALGKIWHPSCFRCASCKKTIHGQSFLHKDNKPYHRQCYQKLFVSKCCICSIFLTEVHLVDYWGNKFCRRHQKENPPCLSCGRLLSQQVTKGGRKYKSGYCICNLCRRYAIDTPGRGEQILSQVMRNLATIGLDLGRINIPLRLTTLDVLSGMANNDYTTKPEGMIKASGVMQNGKRTQCKINEILALRGLHQVHLSSVLAHELGHGYLLLNGFPQLAPVVEEGFAELCCYLWLKDRKTTSAKYHMNKMENNPHNIYGKGFKAALRSYKKYSLSYLLTYIKKNKKFP